MTKQTQRQIVRDTVLDVLKEGGIILKKGEKAADHLKFWGESWMHREIVKRLKTELKNASVSGDIDTYVHKIVSERLKYDEELNGGTKSRKKNRLPNFLRQDEVLIKHRVWKRYEDMEVRKIQLIINDAIRRGWLDEENLPKRCLVMNHERDKRMFVELRELEKLLALVKKKGCKYDVDAVKIELARKVNEIKKTNKLDLNFYKVYVSKESK